MQRLLAEGPRRTWWPRTSSRSMSGFNSTRASTTSRRICQDLEACRRLVRDASVVYNLAADMGGMGFIETHKALCMLSVLINTHMLMAARDAGVRALLLLVVGLRLQRVQAGGARRGRPGRGATPIPPCRKTATAGKSCSASGCAATSGKISGSRRAWPAITTSTGRTAPTTADEKKRPRRSAER